MLNRFKTEKKLNSNGGQYNEPQKVTFLANLKCPSKKINTEAH